MSPDGMYYWDGQTWKTTLSPDGRFRWDGSRWSPVPYMVTAPYGIPVPRVPREPTSWTKPLQYAVGGWYVWSALYSLAAPFWSGSLISNAFQQSFQRQQQLNPDVSPPPAEFVNVMSGMVTAIEWISVAFNLAIFAVIIVGTWKRWVWMYYVVLVLLGIGALLLPFQIIDAFIAPSVASAMGFNFALPSWLFVLAIGSGVVAAALFVWMLVALIKRGPWAMRRPAVS